MEREDGAGPVAAEALRAQGLRIVRAGGMWLVSVDTMRILLCLCRARRRGDQE